MALNFPSSPALNQVFTDGDRTWIWNGSAWISGAGPSYVPLAQKGAPGGVAAYDDCLPQSLILYPFFTTPLERLHLAASGDGVNFVRLTGNVASGVNGSIRDPSIFYRSGWWYMSYSPNSFSASQSLYISRSRDLRNWSAYATVDFSSVGGASLRIWSPEWFEDDDGTVSIYVACNPDYTPVEDFAIYRITATNAALSTWSAPALVFNEFQAIDPYVIKDGGTYYLFYKNEAIGQKFIEVASAATAAGPFTRIRSGNWAGWGSQWEGISVLRRGTGDYLLYADAYAAATGMAVATSTSLLSGWSGLTTINKVPMGIATLRHGSPMLLNTPEQMSAFVGSLLCRDTFPELGLSVAGTAAAQSTLLKMKVAQNAVGSAAAVDVIVDGGDTPLGQEIWRRVNTGTGEMEWELKSWNGSALANVLTLGRASLPRITAYGPVRTATYTVATLPAGGLGDRAMVTDASSPTYLGALTGGGSTVCPVFHNGSAWRAG